MLCDAQKLNLYKYFLINKRNKNMEGTTITDYEYQIRTILETNPATPSELNAQLLAFDSSLASVRMQSAYENITKTILLSVSDALLIEQAKGLL